VVNSAQRCGEGWTLQTTRGEIRARAVVWATGRSWRLARSLGARVHVHQMLAAYVRFFAGAPGDGRLVIEARPEGWWYSADLPDARRAVTCLSDPDIVRDLDLRGAGWHRALAATRHMASLLPPHALQLDALVSAAGTTTLEPAAGERWVAAGDTLFAADPLSSRGLVHALRSGVLAAYAVADMLAGRSELARARYAMIAARSLAGYAPALATHYAAAARWDTPFWQRRRGTAAFDDPVRNRRFHP
jgi:flavin-dependent dehydrogenase